MYDTLLAIAASEILCQGTEESTGASGEVQTSHSESEGLLYNSNTCMYDLHNLLLFYRVCFQNQ